MKVRGFIARCQRIKRWHLFVDRGQKRRSFQSRIRNASRIVRRTFARSDQWAIAIPRITRCNYKICRVPHANIDRWPDVLIIKCTATQFIQHLRHCFFFAAFTKSHSTDDRLIVDSSRDFLLLRFAMSRMILGKDISRITHSSFVAKKLYNLLKFTISL